MKRFLTLILSLSLALNSCSKSDSPAPEPEGDVILSSESGSECVISQTMLTEWSASCSADWFSVSPASGNAGTYELSVKSNSANTGVADRTGYIYISAEGKVTSVSVLQQAAGVIATDESIYYASMYQGDFSINVKSNLDFTVSTNQTWISHKETKKNSTDYEVILSINQNDSAQDRSSVITFTAGEISASVTLIQDKWIDVNWEEAFFRRSVGFKFTACWCGYCPVMALGVESAQETNPDRLYAINIHPKGSESTGKMEFSQQTALLNYYNCSGYPSLFIDERAEILYNTNNIDSAISELLEETSTDLPSQTGLIISSSTDGELINVTVKVCSKISSDYKLAILLMENNITAPQEDYLKVLDDPENYVHNHIARTYFTELFGDPITVEEKRVERYVYSMAVPGNVIELNNCSIIAYTYLPSDNEGGNVVNPLVIYKNYGLLPENGGVGYVIDNAVCAPIGKSSELKYE